MKGSAKIPPLRQAARALGASGGQHRGGEQLEANSGNDYQEMVTVKLAVPNPFAKAENLYSTCRQDTREAVRAGFLNYFEMKRVNLFFLWAIILASCICFSSCEKDDDTINSNIVGVWIFKSANLQELTFDSQVSSSVRQQVQQQVSSLISSQFNTMVGTIWTFDKKGKVVITGPDGEDPDVANYTDNGNKLIVAQDGVVLFTGEYGVVGNALYYDIDVLSVSGGSQLTSYGVTGLTIRLNLTAQ